MACASGREVSCSDSSSCGKEDKVERGVEA